MDIRVVIMLGIIVDSLVYKAHEKERDVTVRQTGSTKNEI